jgi:hypothetical protein
MTETDADMVQMATRDQSTAKLWYDYRAGRVTASNLKAVCCTDADKPSLSLIQLVCYPYEHLFNAPATDWGLSKKPAALCKYKDSVSSHTDLSVDKCGLVINTDFAFMGASPDAFVSCTCCGNGVVEVKCPYKHRNATIDEYLTAKDSCFDVATSGLHLKTNHAYYYQVQAQLHVCDVKYCDFVLCTFPGSEPTVLVSRIYRDEDFWAACFPKARHFFYTCVLPELLGKAYTRQQSR